MHSVTPCNDATPSSFPRHQHSVEGYVAGSQDNGSSAFDRHGSPPSVSKDVALSSPEGVPTSENESNNDLSPLQSSPLAETPDTPGYVYSQHSAGFGAPIYWAHPSIAAPLSPQYIVPQSHQYVDPATLFTPPGIMYGGGQYMTSLGQYVMPGRPDGGAMGYMIAPSQVYYGEQQYVYGEDTAGYRPMEWGITSN